jgi:hypothetical protein
MPPSATAEARPKPPIGVLGLAAIILFAVLFSPPFFGPSFLHDNVIFSNDGPLGAIIQKADAMPGGFHGCWADLTWIGGDYVSARPCFTCLLATVLQPIGYAKYDCPIVFCVLGICACFFFRQLKLAPMACVIAGLAAGLDGDFFSTGCWGVIAQPACFASIFLALAALADLSSRRVWLRVILAGFAIGHSVMEGYDIGALFSLFVAAFVLFQSWNVETAQPFARRTVLGLVRLGVVAVFAGFIAVQTVDTLINTQIKGIVGTAQDEQTREARWGEATMWSVPKKEALGIIVPGLFGYRMDTLGGGNYWGAIGEHYAVPTMEQILADPNASASDKRSAAGFLGNANVWRFSGSGIYAGVLVVIVALWAVAGSFRNKGSPFSIFQRRAIWFWTVIAVIGILFGFGKNAPFFRLFYDLPYASTMRNPFKFMHVFHMALIILFAYGLHGLWVAYMQNPAGRAEGLSAQFRAWRTKAMPFERYWLIGCVCFLVLGVIAAMIYASSSDRLIKYLQTIAIDPDTARAIARFSLQAAIWAVVFLALSVIVLSLVFIGALSGPLARWGAIILGAIVVTDLGRADLPWIVYWNYPYKYATNPIIDFLKERPYDARVTAARLNWPQENQDFGTFEGVYGIEWTQQIFLYYNIQDIDVIMEPREQVDNSSFRSVISAQNPATTARHWQLTNTRYIFAPVNQGVEILNHYFDPVLQRFKVLKRFDIVPKKDILGGGKPSSYMDMTAVEDPQGQIDLIEFTGALPRVKLYSNWQVYSNWDSSTERDSMLNTLANPAFDPVQTVLVGDPIAAPNPATTNQFAGTAEINTNYQPKRVEINADVKAPSVLLFNDKYSPSWHVTVDGQPAQMLRCNYLMRGVRLDPGQHDVVFQYMISDTTLYLSVAAIVVALCLCVWVVVDGARDRPAPAAPRPAPAVASKSSSGK